MQEKSIPPHLYKGPSMNPTLRVPDVLQIVPYKDKRDIRRGDVIVFVLPGRNTSVTHRVTAIGPQGIKTRGDNFNQDDLWTLQPDMVLGRVVNAHTVTKKRPIYGGLMGQMVAKRVGIWRVLAKRVSYVLSLIYQSLAECSIFRKLLPVWLRPQITTFKGQSGTEYRIDLRGYTIGRLSPGMVNWQVRRPFRLFIDEELLNLKDLKAGLKGDIMRHNSFNSNFLLEQFKSRG